MIANAKIIKRVSVLLTLFALASCGGGAGSSTAPSNVDIPALITAGSEGTAQAPVTVQIGTPRPSSVGTFTASYYAFTPAVTGTYVISLSNPTADVRWRLYSGAGLTNEIASCDRYFGTPSTESCAVNLQANATYYLLVNGFSLSLNSISFSLSIDRTVNEGSPSAPVTLTVGTARAGSVDLSGISYYVFTPAVSGANTLAISNSTSDSNGFTYGVSYKVYSSPLTISGQTPLKICDYMANPSCTINGLVAGAPYYVTVLGSSSSGIRYNILVSSGVSEGSVANPLALIVGDAAHSGAVDASATSYYSFTTGNAGEYLLTLTGGSGPSTYSGPNADFTSTGSYCSMGQTCSMPGLDAHRTYYVKLSNPLSSVASYSISVAQGVTEGSAINPVVLTVGAAAHTATIAAAGPYGAGAYYSFTTTTFAGSYTISLTGTQRNLSWELFSDAGFAYVSKTCNTNSASGAADEICVTSNLEPNQTYYLKVVNNENSGSSTYGVAVAEGGGSEGTLAHPVSITEGGLAYTGSVLGYGTSYYSFTTGSTANLVHAVFLNGMTGLNANDSLSLSIYDSASNSIISCSTEAGVTYSVCSTQSSFITKVLAANTTYYLQVRSSKAANSKFDLTEKALDPAAGCVTGNSECFNIEGGFPTNFVHSSSGGTAQPLSGNNWKWKADATNAASGSSSLVTGSLGQFEQACFAYAPNNPAGLSYVSFSYKAIWPDNQLWLEMSGDGGVTWNRHGWSASPGTTPWQRVIMSTSWVSGAALQVKWCARAPSVTTGSDTAWIDDIEFR